LTVFGAKMEGMKSRKSTNSPSIAEAERERAREEGRREEDGGETC
jgi:hypothetical protein